MPNEQQIRVLFVSYTSDWTGPTNSLLLLLDVLRKVYDVKVLCVGSGRFTELLYEKNIPYYSFDKLDKSSILPISRLLLRERISLVYGNTTHGSSRNALIAAKMLGIPFICHAREMGWDKDWRTLGFLRFADATIAVSQACAKSIARFVKPGRLHVVYNGVLGNYEVFEQNKRREYLLREVGLQAEHQVVISVSHIAKRKGQHLIVEAFNIVSKQIPTAQLLLVGSMDRDTAYTLLIRDRIAALNLEDVVQITGLRLDVFELLHGADVFVHTALKEPHPRAVIEAMQAKLPVVAFCVDGVAETVIDGQTGYLIDLGDEKQLAEKLIKLLQDPNLRAQMGKAGSERVRSAFDAKRTGQEVAEIISKYMD